MNPYSIPNIAVAIYIASLGVVAFSAKPNARRNRLFFIFSILISIWHGLYGIVFSLTDYNAALFVSKLAHTGVIFLTPAGLLLVESVTEKYSTRGLKALSKASLLIAVISSVLVYVKPQYYLPSLREHWWGYYPAPGPLMCLYGFWTMGIAAYLIYFLVKATQKAKHDFTAEEYQRFKYYAISLSLFCLSSIDYLSKILDGLYPTGYIFCGFFATTMTYAMIRHKLMDINLLIRRSFVYSLLVFVMTLIYLGIVLVGGRFFEAVFHTGSIPLTLAASLIIALIFNPLRERIQRLIDKYFYKMDPESILKENILLRGVVQKQDQMKAVATLAAGMAHEIKNPLTSIKTFAEFLPDRYNDPEFRDKFKRIVSNEVDRVNNIVKQLLDFAKPQPPNLTTLDVTDLLDETLSLLSNTLVKNQIRLVKAYSALAQIQGDKTQLKQVFLNIALNAIQAMPTGGTLSIEVHQANNTVQVLFRDTGSGIPQENLDHIFDPFFTTKESGSGLGLAISKGILDEHSARIQFSSRSGEGTTVTISFKKI